MNYSNYFLFAAFLWILSFASSEILPQSVSHLRKITSNESQWLETMCGVSSDQITDESGGRRYPWAVSVMYEDRNGLGGTIISPFHILTAAHPFVRFDNSLPGIGEPCVVYGYRHFETNIGNRQIAYGDDCNRHQRRRQQHYKSVFAQRNHRREWIWQKRNESVGTAEMDVCRPKHLELNKIRAVFVDDGFAEGGCLGGHDWAIIEVAERIEFSDTVRPICLPSLELTNLLDGDRFMIVGWGRPTVFGASDPLIKEIPMLHDPKCEAPLSDFMPSKNPDYLCAKALNPRNDDSPRTCHGDSGSGLEHRDGLDKATLLGITSFGSRGCPSNELARFTRVANYLSRICALTGVCYSTEA